MAGATDIIVAGFFLTKTHVQKNIQEFMIETRLCSTFGELREIDKNIRVGTFERWRKFIDFFHD